MRLGKPPVNPLQWSICNDRPNRRSATGPLPPSAPIAAWLQPCWPGFTNPVARAALEHALALYDAQLVDAPVKAAKVPADRKSAAYRAHRTMLLRRLTGTRGKVRAELKAKLAEVEPRSPPEEAG